MSVSEPLSILANTLIAQKQTISAAESCTGGGIAYAFTSMDGSSQWFQQSWVTYSNESKTQALGVSHSLISTHGAVSCEVVEAMAAGACERSGADWGVATSGIAGPGGGTAEKPVGTVWFALACRETQTVKSCHQLFSGSREAVREQAITYAIELANSMVSKAN